MSFFFEGQADQANQAFSCVINLLKSRGTLPNESFTQNIPFFSLGELSVESQIKELFQSRKDVIYSEAILQSIILQLNAAGLTISSKPRSNTQSMSFAQIVLYKVLPCPNLNCDKCPREVVTHNQYTDFEYECPFYHHEKDQRRFVIGSQPTEEFEHKANYFDERRPTGSRDEYSYNYFESMYHPLYYKMFRCRRARCNAHEFCPFFHNDEERMTWNGLFSDFMGKDRASYVKDKEKYYENNSSSSSSSRKSGSQKSNSPDKSDEEYYNEKQRNLNRKNIHQNNAQVVCKYKVKRNSKHALKKWNEKTTHLFNTWEKVKN